ncbi:uncharacterized protein N7459_008936 [Penicillium hispanicum]|uniref:uncharacterized protein n=1 Tax=Penicillium hispanicum TaxID=1080232 RepID=UPI0025423303|nr:uncharacterized protein N7459_008936 [Penicillium hispanicum]KAJ5569506.1 hypothetical protein N7459_008936 [Penicillium hispanicum]
MAAIPTTTRQWTLREKPTGLPELAGAHATFELGTAELPPLQPSQVLLKTIYLSNDPAQRGWISGQRDPKRLYVPPVGLGEPMRALGIAEVIQSTADTLPVGTTVLTPTNWTQYSVHDAKDCQVVQPVPGLRVTHFLGSLGVPGLTAYVGLTEIAKVTKDDTVVVSGAAGATGSMAVQIAKKLIGCKRVIGIAGTEEKCRWVESLGADLCLNYKTDSFEKDLAQATEDYVEVFYDNVGGRILDLMLQRVKKFGRVAACGNISNYNSELNPRPLKNFSEVISNRINIQGFVVLDYLHKTAEVRDLFIQAWKEGKLVIDDSTETVVPTSFEGIPSTWMKLFDGSNTGKLTTELI